MGISVVSVIIATGCFCLLSFVVGAKVGMAVSKGEEIKTPTVNPFKAYHEREQKREAHKEQERLETIMRNIERYDGTGMGQEDVPKG